MMSFPVLLLYFIVTLMMIYDDMNELNSHHLPGLFPPAVLVHYAIACVVPFLFANQIYGYGMVWDGMGWYGMVWDGMEWYGMVWDGMGIWYQLICQ